MTYSPLSTYEIDKESPIGKIMLSENLPYEEAFWKWMEREKIEYDVYKGYAFVFGANEEYSRGSTCIFVPLRRRFGFTKSMCKVGKLDKPDTCYLVDFQTFDKHRDRTGLCRMKGCFDRYECAWYDLREEKDGPWNKIPKDWKTGGEHCESFIQKSIQ